jgi:hypothetical protein
MERHQVYLQTRDFTIAFIRRAMKNELRKVGQHRVFNEDTDFIGTPEFQLLHTNTHYLEFKNLGMLEFMTKFFTICDLNPIILSLLVHQCRVGP